MPLHAKLSLSAYVISGERSANRQKKLRNDAFQVKTSQSAKNQLDPAKNENQQKKRYRYALFARSPRFNYQSSTITSRDGTVVRVLTSHQCGLGLILAHCHMWVEFVVVPHRALRLFLQVLWFFNLTTIEHQLRLMWVEFVVGPHLALRLFLLRFSGFSI